MKIAIHQNANLHPDSFSVRWIERLKELGIEFVSLDFKKHGSLEEIRKCDGAMWHWFHSPDDKVAAPKILDAIEFGLGIPVFPNHATRFHYDEKIAQHYFLDALKVPQPKCWVFWDETSALDFVEGAVYPLVVKLSVGAGSSGVSMLKNKEEAIDVVKEMFGAGITPYQPKQGSLRRLSSLIRRVTPWYYLQQKNYVYFQEFLPGNEFDVRITVIGNRALGFIRKNRPNDFRASGSGNIVYDPAQTPIEAVALAHDISQKCGFQSMAYDFLRNKDGKMVVGEISYCYVDRAVHDCPGYWDRDLKWHEGQTWPQHAHVDDFIESIRMPKNA